MTTTTTNYSWVKPDVGASDDVWGGLLNADLDSIDATVKTVSNTAMGDNRLINGDMRIDQRNAGSSGTATGYTIDRWYNIASQASKTTWQRATLGAGGLALGFGYALQFTSSSAYTPLAADTFAATQFIEADMIGDFAWGTASAQPVTLSFWAQSSLTGTFGGSLQNYAGTRSYPFTYSLPTANTWAKIVVTIPGDTSGTWVLQGNAGALCVTFELGGGSSKRGPAGAWASSGVNGANGAVNVVATSGALFYVTGVKLEIGSVATPYNRQSLAKSMADCQRYYQTTQWTVAGYTQAGTPIGNMVYLGTTMRAAPTIVVGSAIGGDSNVSSIGTPDMIFSNSFRVYAIATATAAIGSGRNLTASAEL